MALFTWTVDDPEVMRFLAEVGVDGVYTRRPDVTRRVLHEWAAARPVPIGTVSVPERIVTVRETGATGLDATKG